MGLFALTQFFGSSILVSVYQNIKSRAGIWQIWKTQGLSSSLTQFTGAALAVWFSS
ncbi:MAG: hypothetical protein IPG67_06025 [Acidobacteria bacterium]|nr:hypothetical protein [Acidobacteriota bacterium]